MRESAFGDRFHAISSDPENDEKRLIANHRARQPFLKKTLNLHDGEIHEFDLSGFRLNRDRCGIILGRCDALLFTDRL
jgi:hypothetical protein